MSTASLRHDVPTAGPWAAWRNDTTTSPVRCRRSCTTLALTAAKLPKRSATKTVRRTRDTDDRCSQNPGRRPALRYVRPMQAETAAAGTAHAREVSRGERFEFGNNWRRFL